MKNMKTFFAMAICLALVLVACPQDGGGGNGATLTVKNESAYPISFVIWNNIPFSNQGSFILSGGKSPAVPIDAGNGYFRFIVSNNDGVEILNSSYIRTKELISVAEGEQATFVILDSTIVVDNEGTSSTLESFAPKHTWLTIKNESVHEISWVYWDWDSFGSLGAGQQRTMNVSAGSWPVRFLLRNSVSFQTQEAVSAKDQKRNEFAIMGSTIVVDENEVADTLDTFATKTQEQSTDREKRIHRPVSRYSVWEKQK